MVKISRRNFVNNVGLSVGAASILPTLSSFMEGPLGKKHGNIQKKLNIALCGLGRYANIMARGFENSAYCNLNGIITGTPEKEIKWKEQYNIPDKNIYNYHNFDRIMDNEDIDLVYITLPNSMHKEYTIRAAQAGKHVIVEKPMALNESDCREMIDVCNQAGVQLAVGYRLHYEPYNMEMKRLGQEKVFGPVRLIEVSLGYSLEGIDPSDWHLNREMAGGGPLMNLGVYCVQAGRYILGEEPIAVTAQYGPVTNELLFSDVEESITWQLTFPSGAVCTSSSTYYCGIDRLYASAEKGFFELSPAVSYGPFKGRSSKGEINFPTINQQTAQLDGIGKYILENKNLPAHISGIEGLLDMKVLDAIYKSADTGKKVLLK